jgi:hypothetical protein
MNEGDFVRLYQRGTANRRDAARVGCVPPEALLAVVEQQGSEEERLASINHAMTCADCGEELELLRATRVVRDRARIPHGGFALAASLVLVAGLGYYTLARRGSPEPAVDSAVMRGVTGDVQRVDSLVWRSMPGVTSYVVEVRREDGTLVTRAATTDTSFVVPDSARVAPGNDVYWTVSARLSDGSELRSAARRVRVTTP